MREPSYSKLRLSVELKRLTALCREKDPTLGKLWGSMEVRNHAITTLVLTLPFLSPIPVPGLSLVLGPMVMFVGGCMALGIPPWIPKFLRKKKLNGEKMCSVFQKSEKVMRHFEKVVRPRGGKINKQLWFQQFNGLVICISGGLLALPLPPGTNVPPALAVIFLSLGVLELDLFFVFLGYLLTIFTIVAFVLLAFFSSELLRITSSFM